VRLVRVGPDCNFPAILRLIQECFAYMEDRIDPPSSMHRLTVASIAEHARDQEIWIAEDADELVGCVFFTAKPGRLYLGKMAVRSEWRGRGIARLMVEKASERAQALGLPLLELETRIELVENHRTFERLGFAKVGENAHPGYDRTTSIAMQRPVVQPLSFDRSRSAGS
jgi:GNAT superfamily N-acetyltransferase